MKSRRKHPWGLTVALMGAACSTPPLPQLGLPESTPEQLYQATCGGEAGADALSGQISIRVRSKQINGQYPAEVVVRAPDQLNLEFTNLFGGREGRVEVRGDHFEITGKTADDHRDGGQSQWGGIPLRFAVPLFLGVIPCPITQASLTAVSARDRGVEHLAREAQRTTDLQLSGDRATLKVRLEAAQREWRDHQALPTLETPQWELFVYHYVPWVGVDPGARPRAWVDQLRWERSDGPTVEFQFADPDPHSGVARKWQASAAEGEIKVRWKTRRPSVN